MRDVKHETKREISALLIDFERAATEAVAILLSGYRSRPRATQKGPIDFVTEFDERSEASLRVALKDCGFPLVAEEHGGTSAEYTVYIDPLDGTTNYLHGHPFYAITIGLLHFGEPVVGLVTAPSLGITWKGGVNVPSTRNGEVCRVSETADLDSALLATGFPYDRRTSEENNFKAFLALKLASRGVRRCGSAALDLCLVGDGTYDGYWERKLNPWDYAGGAAVVAGAGGTLSAFDGTAPDLRTGYLVASNGHVHRALLSAIQASGG
jgi:myo-inositol-1(or 4)-monophosphatase